MFNGLPATTNPNYQYWDFSKTNANTSSTDSISLTDDCAPFQIIAGGTQNLTVNIYLPTNPPAGKQITIKASNYTATTGTGDTSYTIYDSSNRNTTQLYSGKGQLFVTFLYIPQLTQYYSTRGPMSCWIIANSTYTGDQNIISQFSVSNGTINTVDSIYCTIAGGYFNRAAQTYCTIGGGSGNNANQSYATIAGGSGGTIDATYGSIGGGLNNYVSTSYGAVSGGSANTAGNYSFVGSGNQNNATGANSAIGSGFQNTANGSLSFIASGSRNTTRLITGNNIFGGGSPFGLQGASQAGLLVLGQVTSDATASVLTAEGIGASTNNQVILPNNSAYYFRGELVAGVTGAGNTKGWYIEGVIKRGVGVGTTALVGTPTVTSLYADAGAATWTVTATADTTNGGLSITATGQAATTIRWVCQIRTTEMTY